MAAAKALRDTVSGAGRAASGATGRAAGTATAAGSAARRKAEGAAPTPTELLRQSVQNLGVTLAERAVSGLSGTVSGAAGRLDQYAGGDGGNLLSAVTGAEKLAEGASPVKAAFSAGMTKLGHSVKDTISSAKESLTGGGGKGSGAKKSKVTNIVEHIDVGVPIDLVYDQWTQFADYPKFMKKVEQVEQVSDEKVSWTGHVFWSRRTWESTILEQVPFERIVWRSKGAKGYIDGAVTFHEIGPNLTRIIVVLEYHPNGFFEKTANMWRAAGRRCRLELKLFERHLMTEAVLHPDDIEGWHGEIHDGEIVEDDETARQRAEEDSEDVEEAPEDDGEAAERDHDEADETHDEGEEPDEDDEARDAEKSDETGDDTEDRAGESGARRRSTRPRTTPRRTRERRGARS